MRSMLANHDQDCVIACGPGAVEDTGRALLEEYAESHLVIYVCREPESIQSYLGVEERDKKDKFIQDLHFMFRRSSNLEYFNLSEQSVDSSNPSIVDGLEAILPNRTFRRKSPQTLQNTKADLIRFLRLALGESSQLTDGVFHTLFPPNPEQRIHTNALTCPLSALESISVNLDVLQDGIDVVELVLDMPANVEGYRNVLARDTISRALAMVRRQFAVPVIYHVRLYDISGPTLRRYFDLLHLGLRFAPDYITVDLRGPYEEIRRIVEVKGCTKVVGHLVDTDPSPDQWLSPVPMSRYAYAKELGCEVVRLCQPTLSVEDNFSCHTFLKKIDSLPDRIPTVAYNTGDRGYLSAAFNQVLTPVSHECLLDGSFTEKKPFRSLLSTFSARQIRQTQYTCRALDKLDYYVLGTNVYDSLSPSMHNAGFDACGTPHTYSIFQSATLDEIRTLINARNFGGASISMPFKTEIVSSLESLSPSARIIRAANTLLPIRRLDGADVPSEPRCKLQRNRAGRIVGFYGDNTDWMAVHACVLRYISPANAISPRSIGLVIGAGGMARAAIYALAWLDIRRIFIYNRTVSNAEKLADYYNNITIDIGGAQNNLDITGETPTGTKLYVSVLKSLDRAFPQDCSYPSVIVNTVPLHPIGDLPPPDFRIPSPWLQNPTGGVFVEVSNLASILHRCGTSAANALALAFTSRLRYTAITADSFRAKPWMGRRRPAYGAFRARLCAVRALHWH